MNIINKNLLVQWMLLNLRNFLRPFFYNGFDGYPATGGNVLPTKIYPDLIRIKNNLFDSRIEAIKHDNNTTDLVG
jgi:hypothetical protein